MSLWLNKKGYESRAALLLTLYVPAYISYLADSPFIKALKGLPNGFNNS